MATEIVFTQEALDALTELQLEKLALLNSRFTTAARCRVMRDFTVDSADKPWLVAVFEYNPRVDHTVIQPFVVGISPEGDSHS